MQDLVIIGGGVAGLSAAYYATKAKPDINITLLESSNHLGGKVMTVSENGFLIEGGPDAVVRYKPWALELIHELGLSDSIIGTIPTKPSALLHNGREALPIPSGLQMVIPGDLKAMALTPLLTPLGKLRVLLDWVIPKNLDNDEAFGHFIERRLGKQIWERLVAPLSGGIYGGDPYDISTLAAFPQLKALEQTHGSLLRGAIEQRKARGSREGGQIFASLKYGLGEWVSALSAKLQGVKVHLNTPARALQQHADSWQVHTSDGAISAHAVLLATSAKVTANLLYPLNAASAQALDEIPYGHSATVSLAFPKEKLPKRIGHGMLMISDCGFKLRGFTWTDQKWPERAPEDFGLVRGYFSGVHASKEELVEMALADLQKLWYKVPEVSKSWVFQWQEGLPQYKVGHIGRVKQALEVENLPGLFLAGAAYHGVGLPEVVKMGKERAISAVKFLETSLKVHTP